MPNSIETIGQKSQSPQPLLVRYRWPIVIAAHALLISLALFVAFVLAYNVRWEVGPPGDKFIWFLELFLPIWALALPIKLLVFHWTRQFYGSWRYVSLRDLSTVLSATLVASFAFLSAYFVLENVWEQFFGTRLIDRAPSGHLRQSSVFVIDWAAMVGSICAAKIAVRFYYDEIQPRRASRSTRVLIVGAGDAGEAVMRQLPRTRHERFECVGFLDDQVPHLHGRIHDVEVLGRTSQIRDICLFKRVEEVFIALPSAGPKTIRQLVERCEGTGVRFRTIPTVADLIEGRVQVRPVREVDITDLLGREPVQLDTDKIGEHLRGMRVLVTGAGGSIGSEMCRQIAAYDPEKLVLFERSENALFEVDRELRRCFSTLTIVPNVGDILDRERLGAVFDHERPSIVFHAAAHKHVPMMELNPSEAVKNNVGGTVCVANECRRVEVQRMVMISTDKAINPTSVMGCTKRLAEMYVQSCASGGPTQFITVRFGNVLGSSGSVVPIFRQQIVAGGPVTVTHPEMRRYFMTITEAAQLVLQAGAMGVGGEIYILQMGEPVRIVDLARDMITLSGLRPGIDIDIVFTGKRPGEKLFEELSATGEHVADTAHPKIGIWKHRPEDPSTVRTNVERLLQLADVLDNAGVIGELLRAVPDYVPESSTASIHSEPVRA